MLASLLFSGVATACQHNVATIPAQDYAGNAFNTSAAPSPDTKDRKKQAGKDEVIDTREYQVKDFDHIDCGTIANIYFTQGNETRVVAVTPREPRLAGSLNPQRLPQAADRRLRSSHQAL